MMEKAKLYLKNAFYAVLAITLAGGFLVTMRDPV
jgi:hypothetical protein